MQKTECCKLRTFCSTPFPSFSGQISESVLLECIQQNLLAECAGQPTQAWADVALPLFMKVGEVEFHTLGEVRATDVEERRVDDGSQPGVWQSVLFRGEKPVGLRWVGTRTGFTDWESRLA